LPAGSAFQHSRRSHEMTPEGQHRLTERRRARIRTRRGSCDDGDALTFSEDRMSDAPEDMSSRATTTTVESHESDRRSTVDESGGDLRRREEGPAADSKDGLTRLAMTPLHAEEGDRRSGGDCRGKAKRRRRATQLRQSRTAATGNSALGRLSPLSSTAPPPGRRTGPFDSLRRRRIPVRLPNSVLRRIVLLQVRMVRHVSALLRGGLHLELRVQVAGREERSEGRDGNRFGSDGRTDD